MKSMFDLHPLAVDDALNGKQVPKVEVYGDQLFVIIKTAHLEGDKIADHQQFALIHLRVTSEMAGLGSPQFDALDLPVSTNVINVKVGG